MSEIGALATTDNEKAEELNILPQSSLAIALSIPPKS